MVSTLGIEITDLGDEYISGKMPVDERTKQPFGLLHGGASAAFAETLGSIGAGNQVDLGQFAILPQLALRPIFDHISLMPVAHFFWRFPNCQNSGQPSAVPPDLQWPADKTGLSNGLLVSSLPLRCER